MVRSLQKVIDSQGWGLENPDKPLDKARPWASEEGTPLIWEGCSDGWV